MDKEENRFDEGAALPLVKFLSSTEDIITKVRTLFLLIPLLLFAQEQIQIDLQEPSYSQGVLQTKKGGVITSDGIRIQAQNISYNREENSIDASGDLLIDYDGRYLGGERLIYNFTTQEGKLYEGRTMVEGWFISGKEIALNCDRSLSIREALITTSENAKPEWSITARGITIEEQQRVEASGVSFRVVELPLFHLPRFKSNLRYFRDSPVRYKIDWATAQGPRFSMRYRIYSWDTLDLYTRFDLRPFTGGVGGAVESDYHSEDGLTRMLTKNYLGYDTFYNDDDPKKKSTRFRLQGRYTSRNEKSTIQSYAIWDKFNDKNMPGDFGSSDFELTTARRSYLWVRQIEDRHIASIYANPRINSFQGFKQELPSAALSLRPFTFGSSGIVMDNRVKTSYLDYSFSDDIDNLLRDFHAIRLETDQRLYRPFNFKYATLTPDIGFTGIYYNNSPSSEDVGQVLFRYGAHLTTTLRKNYSHFSHLLRPYAEFRGITDPTISPDSLFIFDLADGYNRLNFLRWGAQSDIFGDKWELTPLFTADLYAITFFGSTPFSTPIPKAYADLNWNLSRVQLFANLGWNFNENLLDRANFRLLFTVNPDCAVSVEFRHRSRFDWRKVDHNNYILDVTRSIDEIEDSPLSDGRNTFLGRIQINPRPDWTVRFETHSGWGRANEPAYLEYKGSIYTMVTANWRLRLTYLHTVRADKFTFSLKMVH
ncbi:MAG: hypothetical protein SNF33_07335 [Candidatus Algichlamydia australiensis]|nr:hypothetical protein [Chlamydiales bacterium]